MLSVRSNVAGFLSKAYQIFDNPTWSDVCGWGQGGETVVIRQQVEFAQRILPLFFNHSNLQSFVRQVNKYSEYFNTHRFDKNTVLKKDKSLFSTFYRTVFLLLFF